MADTDDPTQPGDGAAATRGTADDGVDDLAFGPSGYLPAKASARARKIVLRAPMGIHWVIAAVVFAVLVLVAGGLWLARSGPPGPPWVAAATLADIDRAMALPDLDALVVTADGPVVVFTDATAHDLAWCPESGRVEGTDGVWSASTGRGMGVDSLERHPVLVHGGTVYVNPDVVRPGPRPSDTVEHQRC